MYGGLLAMRSKCVSAAIPSSTFVRTNSMRSAKLCRSAFRLATLSAAGEISVAINFVPGKSFASAIAIHPEPVPMSAICSPSPLSVCLRPARISRSASRSSATSITCSVSGRGIKTSGVTSNSSPQNSCLPVRYCVGSPAARRSTSDKNRSSCSMEISSSGCA